MKRNFVNFKSVDITDGFWKKRYELNKSVSVENVKKQFENSGRFDAMRFNYHKTAKRPHIFFDSDVAKWIEGVAYLIKKKRELRLEAIADTVTDQIEKKSR